MITKKEAYDFLQWNKSRYEAMVTSDHPEDRANAEAPRLAVVVWQGVAEQMGNPDFDPDVPRRFLRESWAKYLETGIPNDLAAVAEDNRAAQGRYDAAMASYQERLASGLPMGEPPLSLAPYDLEREVSTAIHLSPSEVLANVSPDVIDEFAAEYNRSFPAQTEE